MLKRALFAFVLALAAMGAFQVQTQVQVTDDPIPRCYPCPKPA